MKTCSTCKHWKHLDENSTEGEVGLSQCGRIPEFKDSVYYDDDGKVSLKSTHVNEKAFTSDGEFYFSRLLTKGDFGCNQHEGF